MACFRKGLAVFMVLLFLLVSACATSIEPSEAPSVPDSGPSGGEDNQQNGEKEDKDPVNKLTSLEFARLMGYGINLGNTMEACNNSNRVPNREPSVYETMWGQPVTTQEMITGMREAGFKNLRIPVAWMNAMDFESGDYTILEAYLDRVEEIVNYALNEDMYVTVNDHWDHGWWSMFGHPDQAVRDQAMEIFTAMWTQISERFKDYDHRLVFEGGNEEWGNRFNDRTSFSPDGGSLSRDECYKMLTAVAQRFVDTVRGVGGGNTNRFLLIPGYNTNISDTCDNRFQMPADTAKDKLMLSVHFYDPFPYAHDGAVEKWGTVKELEEMNRTLGRMAKYTEMGYGVVLGEWGVLSNPNEDRLGYFTNFLDICDLYGFVPILWDTGEMYSKADRRITAPEIAELFASRSVEARASMTVEEIIAAADENIALSLQKAADRPMFVLSEDESFAWIMFNGGGVVYSVGDKYDPDSKTKGIDAVDVQIIGAGIYTVSLDLTEINGGSANGIDFSALGLANGEILFPGYIIEIKEVLINGEPAELVGDPYTTSDDKKCTRVNLYNGWVSQVPGDARVLSGDVSGASPTPLQKYTNTRIRTIEVTFEFIEGNE
ncbi:MAG: glycoside hydrolase family 5 protein [Oscillospiraceae bacterium]|jgi:endoglucanase|nr:glycoside hydrolase family 5 protein [Oscillospiraceae bacterium]